MNLKEIDKHVLQPFWDELFHNPVAQAYVNFLAQQARGKYKPLPQWLKLVLQEMAAYDIDLTIVSYAEGIDTIFGNGVTIGYCIHFPRGINLDRTNPNEDDVR